MCVETCMLVVRVFRERDYIMRNSFDPPSTNADKKERKFERKIDVKHYKISMRQ